MTISEILDDSKNMKLEIECLIYQKKLLSLLKNI